MSKENRPAFMFYASDWLTSTAFMDAETRGMYINLLSYQWVNGELPNDLPLLARLAGVDSASSSATSKLQALIKQKFKQTASTCLINERLERVREKAVVTASNLSERGRKGAIAKQANALNKQRNEPELSLNKSPDNDLLNSASSSACEVLSEYEYKDEYEIENRNEIRGVQGGNFDGVNIEEEVAQFIETFGVGQKRHQTERAYVNTVRHLTNPSGGMGYRARDACLMLRQKAASYRAFCIAVNQIQQHPPKWLSERGYMTDWNQELVNQREIQKGKNENGHGKQESATLAVIRHNRRSGL